MSSELATLARPYAAAVFKRAKETASAGFWFDTLTLMSAVVTNPEMKPLIGNPKLNKDALAALILEVCQGHVDKESGNFLKLLSKNNRLNLLPSIAHIFEEFKAEDEGYIPVEVWSAFPFNKEDEIKFAANLEKALNKKIHMTIAEDKSLIGGVLVRAGDKVMDGSIKGQLDSLRKALQ